MFFSHGSKTTMTKNMWQKAQQNAVDLINLAGAEVVLGGNQ